MRSAAIPLVAWGLLKGGSATRASPGKKHPIFLSDMRETRLPAKQTPIRLSRVVIPMTETRDSVNTETGRSRQDDRGQLIAYLGIKRPQSFVHGSARFNTGNASVAWRWVDQSGGLLEAYFRNGGLENGKRDECEG